VLQCHDIDFNFFERDIDLRTTVQYYYDCSMCNAFNNYDSLRLYHGVASVHGILVSTTSSN